MKTVVRKSYVVMHNSMRFTEGMEIPSNLLPIIEKNQSWKIEVVKDAKEKETSSNEGADKKEQEEEKEVNLSDFKKDKMVHEEKVRKRG